MVWSKNCSADQNKTILWSHHVKTGKFREIQLNQQTIRCQDFCLSAENMELSPIYQAVMTFRIYIPKSKFLYIFQVCIKGEKDQLMFHSDRFVRQKLKNDFFRYPLFLLMCTHVVLWTGKKVSIFGQKKIEPGLRTFQITLVMEVSTLV